MRDDFRRGPVYCGPAMGWWLPKNISETGRSIDHLFMFILVLTGVVFIGTELALFLFLWRYDGESQHPAAKFTHGSHTLEICWTIVPAATLLFIAIYQMNTWAAAKMRPPNAVAAMLPTHRGSDRPAIRMAAALSGEAARWKDGIAGHQGRFVRRERSARAGQ